MILIEKLSSDTKRWNIRGETLSRREVLRYQRTGEQKPNGALEVHR